MLEGGGRVCLEGRGRGAGGEGEGGGVGGRGRERGGRRQRCKKQKVPGSRWLPARRPTHNVPNRKWFSLWLFFLFSVKRVQYMILFMVLTSYMGIGEKYSLRVVNLSFSNL